MTEESREVTEEKSREATELEKLKAREAAAQARINAIETKQLLRERARAVEEREREAEEVEVLDRLQEEHGEVGKLIDFVRSAKGVVVVKRALGVIWNRYENSKMKAPDREKLVEACLVYPDRQTYNAIVADQPALVLTLADKLVRLYGFKREEESGK